MMSETKDKKSDDNKSAKALKPLLSYGRSIKTSLNDEQGSIPPPWTPPAPKNKDSVTAPEKISAPEDVLAKKQERDQEIDEIQQKLLQIRSELDARIKENKNLFSIDESEDTVKQAVADNLSAIEKAQLENHNFHKETLKSSASAIAQDTKADTAPDNWKPLIDPLLLLKTIWRSKILLLVCTAAGGALAVAYALSQPPIYEAYTDLLVDPRNISIVERELSPGQLPTDASLAIAESQAQMIGSSSVLLKVIKQENLLDDPEFNGTQPPYGPFAPAIEYLRSLRTAKPEPSKQQLETRVLQNFHKSLIIHRDAKTFIYVIGIKSQNPEKSAQLANAVSDVFQQELNALQQDAAKRTSDGLNQRLDMLRESVEKAESAVDEFRATHDLIGVQGRLISDDDLIKLNEQLADQRAEIVRLTARETALSNTSPDQIINSALPEELTSSSLAYLRSQYSAAQQQVAALSQTLGPLHPQLRQAQSQMDGARLAIEGELNRIRSSLQMEKTRAQLAEEDLSNRLAQMKEELAESNNARIKLRELEREAAARRNIYESLLLRSRETSEQEAQNSANIRVISEARPPLESVSPKRKLITIIGLVLGFMFGMGLVFLRVLRQLFWGNKERGARTS